MDLFGEHLKKRVTEALWQSDREVGANGTSGWPSYEAHTRAVYSHWGTPDPWERHAQVAMRTIQDATFPMGGA
jgi:hypothetical protein